MTNRIDHTGCSHDRTPKARAACRKAVREANRPIAPGDIVIAKLDDAPEFEAEVVSTEPWGRGVRYNVRCVGGSGWVYGTCRVRKIEKG